jgi:3-oxoacyl-[acyl-carrier-protein] synthase II
MPEPAVISALGVAVAGLGSAAHLLGALATGLATEPTFDPRPRLGERGWRHHDLATVMALCAASEAVAELKRPDVDWDGASTGVVVSCNLGNLDTVCRVVDVIHAGSTDALSPMDLPKASSNVIASTLAIHFDCRGINLMVCNGASSGLDALYLAAAAIHARRVVRVLVVGVEAAHREARRLLESTSGSLPFRGGAAGVLVEAAASARARGARVYAEIGAYAHHQGHGAVSHALKGALDRSRVAGPALWITPERRGSMAWRDVADGRWTDVPPPCVLDLTTGLGLLYGALGVFQCAAASLWLDSQGGAGPAVLTSGGGPEGASALVLTRSCERSAP